jgi:hypothetical protein
LKREQFSLAVLLALVLLTVSSAPWSGQQSSNAYDAWLDYNEDGVIDVNELYRIAEAYGSSGEPIRNVTVSGHVTSYIRLGGESNISIPALSNWLSEMITIDGYAKVTILIRVSNSGSYNVIWDLLACDNDGHSWLIETVTQGANNWVKTYDAMSQGIRIKISNSYNFMITADVAVYLVA